MDWILSILLAVTYYFIGNKNVWGMRLAVFTGLLWIIYPLIIHQPGLILGTVLTLGMNIRNLIKWERERINERKISTV